MSSQYIAMCTRASVILVSIYLYTNVFNVCIMEMELGGTQTALILYCNKYNA